MLDAGCQYYFYRYNSVHVHIQNCLKKKELCEVMCFVLGWIDVAWDSGGSNSYRMGAEGKFDLMLAPSHDPEKIRRESTSSRTSEQAAPTAATAAPRAKESKGKTSVLTSRKSSSTPSLSDVSECGHPSVASTEQAASAENLTSAIKRTAESVAESVLSLASEAMVTVTVDPVSEENQNNQLASGSAAAAAMDSSAPTVVHRSSDIGSAMPTVLSGISEHEGAAAPAPTPNSTGSPTGVQTPAEPVEEEMEAAQALNYPAAAESMELSAREMLTNMSNRDHLHLSGPAKRLLRGAAAAEAQKGNNQTRSQNANPMSVSVPNLTSNMERMEQTVSLLESFAAVARRNLGNSASNMRSNASSLVRLALSSGSPGNTGFIDLYLSTIKTPQVASRIDVTQRNGYRS